MIDDGNKSKQIARNTIYLYIRMILVMGVNLYTSRIVLNILGFEDFGIYNIVGSVVVFLSFLQAALRNATFRHLTYELGKGNIQTLQSTYSMAINCHLMLVVLLFIVMEIAGVWFVNYELNIDEVRLYATNWTFQYSLLTFCLSIIRTPYESNILAYERMDFYAITSILEVLLKLGAVYLLIFSPFDKLISYASLLFIVSLLMFICYVWYCKNQFGDCKYVRGWNRVIFRKFASYSGWALLVNGATITRTQCINIFFNLFLGVLANAALGIANQVVGALNAFVSNFTQAFQPQLIKSWAENNYDYFIKILLSSSKMSYYLMLMVSVPIIANIDYILKIWLVDYPPMASVFVISIILYYLVDALQTPLVISVHATGILKFHQIMIASIVFLVIPVSYIMLKLGCSGASVLFANALANTICAIARTIYMRILIRLNITTYIKEVLLPIVGVTIIATPVPIYLARIYEPSYLSVFANTLFSISLTLFLCYCIGFNKSERKFLLSVFVSARRSLKIKK